MRVAGLQHPHAASYLQVPQRLDGMLLRATTKVAATHHLPICPSPLKRRSLPAAAILDRREPRAVAPSNARNFLPSTNQDAAARQSRQTEADTLYPVP
jgi:hypothetical protein